jgi:diacylglycerol kinase (ATP)
LRLTLDDEILEDRFRMVVVCNTKFTGKGMQLAPHAEVGDGRLDVVFVRDASRWQMLKLLQSVFDGSHLSLPCVEYRQVTSFAIQPEQDDLLNFDGELKGQTPVSGEILPGALQIFA